MGCRRFQNFYYLCIEIFSKYSHKIGITNSNFYGFLPKRKHVVQDKRTDCWRKFLSDKLHYSFPQNISNFMISRKLTWLDQIIVMRDFRLPAECKWDLYPSEILRTVEYYFLTAVSVKYVCSIFRGKTQKSLRLYSHWTNNPVLATTQKANKQ